MDYRILGPVEVVDGDGAPLALGGAKQRALLALLVVHRDEVVSSDRLIEELWDERPPATAPKTLQGYVSRLRKALGDGVLETHGHGYRLAVAADDVDAARFEQLVERARHATADGDLDAASGHLEAGLALWRGAALADLAYEPGLRSESARLEELRLAAIEDRFDVELARGRSADLVAELEALARANPLRERLRAQLMLALYRAGRQADALAAYQDARRTLDDQLGLEPGPALQQLHQQILTQDPELDAPGHTLPIPRRARTSRTLLAAGSTLLGLVLIAAIVELAGSGDSARLRARPNSVAAIDVGSNRVVGVAGVGAEPGAMVASRGSLWVANRDDETVSRVDLATLRTTRTIPVDGPPNALAAAGGDVWVSTAHGQSSFVHVRRIDPRFDTVERAARIRTVVPGATATLAGDGGSLWVAPNAGLLTRLDASSGRVLSRRDPNAGPAAVAVGAGGVWTTDTQANNVTRIDPLGGVTHVAVGNGPTGIAIGERGVWVTDSLDGAVVRIDPATRSVTTTIRVGGSPAGVAVGAGSVWVADARDGAVSRIDPASGRVVATIPVGGSPQQVVVAGDRAWVTVGAPAVGTDGAALSGGVARLASQFDVDYMDPALAYSPMSWQVLGATCAGLLNYPDASGAAGSRLIPEVAASLPERSADGLTYTFEIRRGFRFSPPSGEPVTARTFKDTIERTLAPRMRSPVAHEFSAIAGAGAYMAGRAGHISGVSARGGRLTIRLAHPAPDLLARLAQPATCAVPSDTPVDPAGIRTVPMAGPYYVKSYRPGDGVVLARNPNYHGRRPHHLERIELAVGVSTSQTVAQVEAGKVDYAFGGVPAAAVPRLAARYGPGSPAAARHAQQLFVNPTAGLDVFVLNSRRPAFADVRLRRAVNYAIDRRTLARLGNGFSSLPDRPTDHYLPPGVPGFRDVRSYPLKPDLSAARRLARGLERNVVLYTCNNSLCGRQAQVIVNSLARIGLNVAVKQFPFSEMFARVQRPGEPYDIGYDGWVPDYLDPSAMLNSLLADEHVAPPLADPHYQRRLAAVARLAGPRRYLAYAKLDAELARRAAPLLAYGTPLSRDFFSARIGCQVHGVYGMDLAALCLRSGGS